MYAPVDTGGSNVIAYELHMDQGEANTEFREVTSYSVLGGSSASLLTHELTATTDSLVPGKV